MAASGRQQWTNLSDRGLLDQCEVDTYRASGPGGQKRNKTSSAVRLRHLPSGVIAIAEESRSQHENRARALRRLRQAMYLKLRAEWSAAVLSPGFVAAQLEMQNVMSGAGRLCLGRRDARFWPVAGIVLDVLQAVEAKLSAAAGMLGITTGNLVDFIRTDAKLWEEANHLRGKFGQKPLRHF